MLTLNTAVDGWGKACGLNSEKLIFHCLDNPFRICFLSVRARSYLFINASVAPVLECNGQQTSSCAKPVSIIGQQLIAVKQNHLNLC